MELRHSRPSRAWRHKSVQWNADSNLPRHLRQNLFNTKGGAGKTSSALTLVSALAERNMTAAKPQSILALDADPQGSLMAFGDLRNGRAAESYGVEFAEFDRETVDQLEKAAFEARFDVTLIDLPGFHDHASLKLAAMSDAILIPTHLSYIEARESMFAMVQIMNMCSQIGGQAEVALLLNRLEANLAFLSRADKEVLQSLRVKEYPILEAFLSRLNAFSSYGQFGKYPFELAREDPQAGNRRATLEAQSLLQCVEAWSLLPSLSRTMTPEAVNHG